MSPTDCRNIFEFKGYVCMYRIFSNVTINMCVSCVCIGMYCLCVLKCGCHSLSLVL